MAFQLPALPNFQTSIPQVDPTQQLTRLAGLRALLSENQLRQQLAPLQVQEATQRAKQAGIQTELSQTQLDSQKAMMQAIASGELNKYAGVETEDGSGFDAAGAYQHLISKGVLPAQASEYTNSWLSIGQKSAEISKTLGQAGEAQQNIREKTLKQVAGKLGDIGDMAATKAAAALDSFRNDLVKNPKAYPGLTQQERADLYGADLGHLDALEGHLGIAAQVADFHKSKAEASKAETEAAETAAEATGKVTPKMATAQRLKIEASKEEAKAHAAAQAALLQGSALDQSAQRYLETGQLPAGMRSPGMSAAIINRAGELGGGQNIAANTAAFKANQASYENVTKTLDTLSAFEQTGLKNLKQFTDLAAKIPDTGVPWLNTPVRALDEKLVGSANMAAVNAARSVALREIARVTNDPKLSGQLSDHAREEVENLVPKNATFNQIKTVANVLQQDMANVHGSLAAQKADIGRRLGLQPGSEQPQANTGGHTIQIGDKQYTYNGTGDTADLKNYTEVKKKK